jgi:hypothetical protein
MAKEKKSVAFSTRFTESMDKALEELSEVKMLTKHDIVRIALSEYLLDHKWLIDENVKYKKDKSKLRYDDFDLITVTSTNTDTSGKWIQGIIFDDNDIPINFVELVKIEVNIPLLKEKDKIPLLMEQLKNSSEEEKNQIEKQLMDLISSQFVEEYTLKYTEDGLNIKEDPKFQQYVERSVSEVIEEIRNPKK